MEEEGPLRFRWLGVAGIELKAIDTTLIIDPYFTRVPFYKMWIGKVIPDRKLIKKHLKYCDHLLITHAHIDHLMDVPDVISNTGCKTYGSENTCKILSFCEIPQYSISRIKKGDILNMDDFKVEVLRANHREVPGFGFGKLEEGISPPFTARQYRMDECFSFHIAAMGITLLTDPGIANVPKNLREADILFTSVTYSEKYFRTLFDAVGPKVLIPIHWDNFFYPLSRPLRPYYKYVPGKFPFLKKVDLGQFEKDIKKIEPDIKVLIPEIFRSYELDSLLME